MKISREKLLRALGIAGRILAKGANLPVLKAVKISGPAQKMYCTNLDVYLTLDLPIEDWRKVKVKEGSFDASTLPKKKAELMAYALEHGVPNVTGKMTAQAIQSKIVEHLSGADVIEETFCLPASDLKKIVASLEVDSIEIVPSTATNLIGSLQVSVGGHFQNLPTLDVAEFPDVPTFAPGENVTTASMVNLDAVARAAVNDPTRAALSCVFFDSENSRVVATDGNRLHYAPAASDTDWLLRADLIRFLAFLSSGKDLSFTLNENNNAAKFVFDGGEAIIRVGDGNFPSYVQLLADMEPTFWVDILVKDLVRATKQALILTDGDMRGMKMALNSTLEMAVNHPDRGQYQRIGIPLQSAGLEQEMVIGINAGFFADIVNVLSGDDKTVLSVGVKDPESGVHFKKGDDEFHGIIMPMRL